MATYEYFTLNEDDAWESQARALRFWAKLAQDLAKEHGAVMIEYDPDGRLEDEDEN